MMKTTSPLPRCFFSPLAAAMVTGLLPAALRAASYIGCRMPCGMPLFQRHARGVELTSAGEIFLRHARSSLRQTERVRSELDALKGLRRGTINIQSIESLVPGVLPQAIMRFRARYPGITFEVTVDR